MSTRYEFAQASDWGMRWVRPPLHEARPDHDVVYHHVGGGAWMNDDAFTVFRQLNQIAINKNHAGGIDYDLAVHYSRSRDLITITEGNGTWRSAATRDWNELGEAIVLCGNTNIRHPVAAELEGMARATVWAIEQGLVVRPPRSIFGHRDNPAHPGDTACPGKFFIPKIPAIVNRVNQLLAPATPTPTPPPSGDIVITYNEINSVWTAPPVSEVTGGRADRWLNVCIAKVGGIGDVQEQARLRPTGRYDQATANAYAQRLAAMR